MSWFPRYYDATTKQEITAQQFDPILVIPLPIGCSNDKKNIEISRLYYPQS